MEVRQNIISDKRGKTSLAPCTGKPVAGAGRGTTCNWRQVEEQYGWCHSRESVQTGQIIVPFTLVNFHFLNACFTNFL